MSGINFCDIIDMTEEEYDERFCDDVSKLAFERTIVCAQINSSEDFECIKRIYNWSMLRQHKNILSSCINKIVFNLKFSDSCIINEILCEIIVSKMLRYNSMVCEIIYQIQSYPINQFEHYIYLILNNYDLQKIFDNAHSEQRGRFNDYLRKYSLNVFEMVTTNGLELHLEEFLASKKNWASTDIIRHIINNIDTNNLSKRMLNVIYGSVVLLEIALSRSDAHFDLSMLNPLLLLKDIDKSKICVMATHGYDFKEIICESICNYKKNVIASSYETNAKSKYIAEILADINLDADSLNSILLSSISYAQCLNEEAKRNLIGDNTQHVQEYFD